RCSRCWNRSCRPLVWWVVGHKGGRTMVEPPGAAAVVVKGVAVAAHELDRPAGVAEQEEDHVADGGGLGVAPLGDHGVEDEVALGSPGFPSRVGVAKCLATP